MLKKKTNIKLNLLLLYFVKKKKSNIIANKCLIMSVYVHDAQIHLEAQEFSIF